jgi:hypothetical protein
MNNYERIKQMSVDEMAEYIFSFQACSYLTNSILTEEEVMKWLLQECEWW